MTVEDTNFSLFKGKKILITGNTGFKGAWLTAWLLKLGADPIGYSLEPPTSPSMYEALELKGRITQITGDVRDFEVVNAAFRKHKPEVVFHMAAQSLVKESYREPRYTYETNILGTVNLLESCRLSDSVKAFVNVSSDKCYENKEWPYAYRENDPMGGFDPYSSSKGCAELVIAAYRNSFFLREDQESGLGLALASVRSGNVIGGGDWSENRIIPDCIRALVEGEKINLRNPGSIRPWQYVLEPLSGYLRLASLMLVDAIRFNEGWNFGPLEAQPRTVEDVVKIALEQWGSGEYGCEHHAPAEHEAELLTLDVTKAMLRLKWRPVYDLSRTISETISWYRAFYDNNRKGMLDRTMKFIEEYCYVANQKGLTWVR